MPAYSLFLTQVLCLANYNKKNRRYCCLPPNVVTLTQFPRWRWTKKNHGVDDQLTSRDHRTDWTDQNAMMQKFYLMIDAHGMYATARHSEAHECRGRMTRSVICWIPGKFFIWVRKLNLAERALLATLFKHVYHNRKVELLPCPEPSFARGCHKQRQWWSSQHERPQTPRGFNTMMVNVCICDLVHKMAAVSSFLPTMRSWPKIMHLLRHPNCRIVQTVERQWNGEQCGWQRESQTPGFFFLSLNLTAIAGSMVLQRSALFCQVVEKVKDQRMKEPVPSVWSEAKESPKPRNREGPCISRLISPPTDGHQCTCIVQQDTIREKISTNPSYTYSHDPKPKTIEIFFQAANSHLADESHWWTIKRPSECRHLWEVAKTIRMSKVPFSLVWPDISRQNENCSCARGKASLEHKCLLNQHSRKAPVRGQGSFFDCVTEAIHNQLPMLQTGSTPVRTSVV